MEKGGRQRPADLQDAKFNSLSNALNSISAGDAGVSSNIGRASRGSRLKVRPNNRLKVSNLQFSGKSGQSNSHAVKSSAGGGALKGSRSRRIPRQQRSRLPVSPLDRHRQMERQVAPNQRMTSAPEPSSFRQQFQDLSSTSRKDGQLGNRHGLLPRPSSRQRASRGRRHVGKSVDNNRLHGFVAGQENSTHFSHSPSGGGQNTPVGADGFQGGSDKADVADFLNSWNRIGRARPKTSDALRQRRQGSKVPTMNSSRGRGVNNGKNHSNLITEDLMIISMSPISIKPRSKDDIFRLGDFDKNVAQASPNNAQGSSNSNSTQLPPFGGYPSLSGDSSKKNFYYGKKNESNGNQVNDSNAVLHTKLLQPPINDQILPTTRVTLDNRPISRGRFRSSRGLPYGIPAVSNRRARTAVGSSRRRLADAQKFSAGSRRRARPSTSGGR